MQETESVSYLNCFGGRFQHSFLFEYSCSLAVAWPEWKELPSFKEGKGDRPLQKIRLPPEESYQLHWSKKTNFNCVSCDLVNDVLLSVLIQFQICVFNAGHHPFLFIS
ncbi:hypothetical protein CDAR_212621 [Caerostris darwini]|uniref:Uncharacterized protein n=1 Tax=Caerostris darwini TaxID=1538125 RepID=A0AAV4PTU1_9ARAC|nr:hypothetical protein CDAR_212621 [Caerostris darwini]